MEMKIDTTGIKDIEKDSGVTVEEMAHIGSRGHVLESCNVLNENKSEEME